jgi:uncharacterized protein DUF6115
MTTFLLVISLLLNGIAIFSIIVLFTRQNRFLEVEKTQKKLKKEMEELISTYLVEMKAENEAFIDRFQQLKQTSLSNSGQEKQPVSPVKDHQVVTAPPQKTEGWIENDWTPKGGKAFAQQAVKAYKDVAVAAAKKASISQTVQKQTPEITDYEQGVTPSADPSQMTNGLRLSQEDVTRNIVVDQIIMLQKQGLSIEKIAKKLNKGKTEIELLLKFNTNPKN